MNVVGSIKAINGLIVEVYITEVVKPLVNSILALEDDSQSILQILGYKDKSIAKCLNITSSPKMFKGANIIFLKDGLYIPSGQEILGHVFDSIGNQIDGVDDPDIAKASKINVLDKIAPKNINQEFVPEIIQTGIKVLDFFTPFVKGRKIGIIGGAGVGKTVLTTEIMNNIGSRTITATFFVGIGERMREGHELYNTLKEKNILYNSAIYLAQMNENAALRSLVGRSAVGSARYFRDIKKQNVLVFIDNIYRHVQASNELSNMLGELPSEGGYQPNIYSNIKELMEGIDTNENGSITAVQSIFVPADDLSDPAVVEISQQLDAVIVLSRSVFESGVFPAVDLLQTNSSLITEEIVGVEHYNLVQEAKKVLQRYETIRPIIAVIGESEISPEDRDNYHRALNLINYFKQNMFVTEDLNGKKGEYVELKDNLKNIKAILTNKEY